MVLLNMTEQKAVDEYNRLSDAYNAADERIDLLFRLRYEPLLKAGKIDDVKEIIQAMPEGVARMYAADALRVARGDYKKGL